MQHTSWQRAFRTGVAAIAFASVVLVIWSCENPQGQLKGNSPPDTKIANIPINDTFAVYLSLGALPEQTLYWSGGDPDGFVIGYRYRWTDSTNGGPGSTVPWTTILNVTTFGSGNTVPTTILVKGTPSSLLKFYHYFQTLTDLDTIRMIGDSLVARRTIGVPIGKALPGDSVYGGDPDANISPNKGVFIFNSPDTANVHRFEIAAIDNNEVVDPTPAYVFFWTQRAPAPAARFVSVARNARGSIDTLILRQLNDRFLGLRMTFTTIDPSTFEQQYSWCVDDTVEHAPNPPTSRWSPWSLDGIAIVTASNFLDTRPDTLLRHRLFLRAKNRWGVISPVAETSFVAILPAIDDPNYPSKIIVINNDKIGNGSRGFPDTNQVNAFYRGILHDINKPDSSVTIWTTGSQRSGAAITYRIPPRTVLSKYRAVLFVYEQPPQGLPLQDVSRKLTTDKQNALRDYLGIGGKLLFSTPPNADVNFDNYLSPSGFPFDGTWAFDIFHMQQTRKNTSRDFIGSKGVLGYPTIVVDSLKLPADSAGAFRGIAVNFPRGWAQAISAFDSRNDNPLFENLPLGIRYKAPNVQPPARQTWSMVFFGFPLYYGEREAVKEALRQAFLDINQ